jgi:hypothetical protein
MIIKIISISWRILKGAIKLCFGKAPSEPFIGGSGRTSWDNLKEPFKKLF